MKLIASNKKANYDFEFSLKLDAGLVLTGSEVKSLRKNSLSIKESYIEDTGNELWLCNCFIKKYESSSDKNLNHSRKRKLLLNKKELNKIIGLVRRDGYAIVPINMFFNEKGLIKLNIGLGKGKKKYDKRESQKLKDWKINKQRLLKKH